MRQGRTITTPARPMYSEFRSGAPHLARNFEGVPEFKGAEDIISACVPLFRSTHFACEWPSDCKTRTCFFVCAHTTAKRKKTWNQTLFHPKANRKEARVCNHITVARGRHKEEGGRVKAHTPCSKRSTYCASNLLKFRWSAQKRVNQERADATNSWVKFKKRLLIT